jgi:alpha-N-arabinofuranosidase
MSESELHVKVDGSDQNPGTITQPLRTIQAAALRAYPGDTVIVHEGEYREQVDPPRGGASDELRIAFQAADGESVSIKGSERVDDWIHLDGNVWMVRRHNDYFGAFNPFANLIGGDWFFPQGRKHHTGAVYLNGFALNEAASLEDLFCMDARQWYAKQGSSETCIWAHFGDADPNGELVEINKRQTVFYPSRPGINFITVRGFTLTQAATPWSPPTTEQIGLIGVNWSKGWIIEDNTITHSRCTGVTLGKFHDRLDGRLEYGFNAHYQTVKRVLDRGDWTKENIGHHLIRNNHIAYCEQAGIVGSHGGAFSEITGNVIHDIHVHGLFGGFEQAGIKLHAPVDTCIQGNLIFNCNMGIWLDWMNQGARVSGNALYGNRDWDLFVEISHGPMLVDNNLLLSRVSLLDSAQGGAYVHNLFAGEVRQRSEPDRTTQYFAPHSTQCLGTSNVFDGDDRFYHNIVMEDGGLKSYDNNSRELWIGNNVYLYRAQPSKLDQNALCVPEADTRFQVVPDGTDLFLELDIDPEWARDHSFPLVTTSLLGKTETSRQGFENADGTPLSIDRDYFGRPRNPSAPFPGPFEASGRLKKIKIWPPNANVRTVNLLREQHEEHEIEPR